MKHLLHSHHPFRDFLFSPIDLRSGSLIFSHMGVSGLFGYSLFWWFWKSRLASTTLCQIARFAGMSQVWQKVFLTAGIFVAVFVVRFILPIAIVMIASGHDLWMRRQSGAT